MVGGIGDAIGWFIAFLAFFAVLGMSALIGAAVVGLLWIFIPSGAWMAYTIGGFTAVGFVAAIIVYGKAMRS